MNLDKILEQFALPIRVYIFAAFFLIPVGYILGCLCYQLTYKTTAGLDTVTRLMLACFFAEVLTGAGAAYDGYKSRQQMAAKGYYYPGFYRVLVSGFLIGLVGVVIMLSLTL